MVGIATVCLIYSIQAFILGYKQFKVRTNQQSTRCKHALTRSTHTTNTQASNWHMSRSVKFWFGLAFSAWSFTYICFNILVYVAFGVCVRLQ